MAPVLYDINIWAVFPAGRQCDGSYSVRGVSFEFCSAGTGGLCIQSKQSDHLASVKGCQFGTNLISWQHPELEERLQPRNSTDGAGEFKLTG